MLFSPNFQANPFGKHERCSQEISYCLATETPAKAELVKKKGKLFKCEKEWVDLEKKLLKRLKLEWNVLEEKYWWGRRTKVS